MEGTGEQGDRGPVVAVAVFSSRLGGELSGTWRQHLGAWSSTFRVGVGLPPLPGCVAPAPRWALGGSQIPAETRLSDLVFPMRRPGSGVLLDVGPGPLGELGVVDADDVVVPPITAVGVTGALVKYGTPDIGESFACGGARCIVAGHEDDGAVMPPLRSPVFSSGSSARSVSWDGANANAEGRRRQVAGAAHRSVLLATL